MKVLTRLRKGFGFLFSGYKILKDNPQLRKWILIPFLIDLVLLFLGIYWGLEYLGTWTQSALHWLFSNTNGFLLQFLYYLALALIWIGFLAVWSFGICLVAGIIASPFNSILAEQTLIALGFIDDQPFQWRQWLKSSLSLVITTIFKTGLFLFLGIIIFFLAFMPGVNFLASYLALMILSFDCLDYSFEVYEMNLRQRISLCRKLLPEMAGMAGALGVTLFIPGLILLVMPLAVIGAASLFDVHSINRRSSIDSRHCPPQNC